MVMGQLELEGLPGTENSDAKAEMRKRYLKWITNKDLLYSTGNSAQCYVAAWLGGESGENGCMYIYG